MSKSTDHGTEFKWYTQGGGQFREFGYCYNGLLGIHIKRSIYGSIRYVEVVGHNIFTVLH